VAASRSRLPRSKAVRPEGLAPHELEALTRGFTHEARNPLFALSANADLLEDRLTDPAVQEIVASVKHEARRLSRHLEALAEFGGTKVDPPAWHAPRALVERALATSASLPGGPQTALACPRHLGRVCLAGEAFERVLVHLFSALAPRWPTDVVVPLTLKARRGAGGAWLALTVGDRGREAPRSSDRRTIFEPYGSRVLGVRGLGLATAARIARRHGGRIRTVGSREHGLQFRLDWPLAGMGEER
jgi:two-component system, NtrC family, sensor histidine kinase HydH